MSDVYTEQIIKRKSNTLDLLKKTGLVMAVIVVFVAASLFITQVALPLTVAAGFGAYWLMGFLNIEYEYIFTNGELDIDIIYNRSNRKKLFNGAVSGFEIMAHVEDKSHTGDFAAAQETRNYGSGVVTDHTYAFLTTDKNKRVKIIIEPNDSLLAAFSIVLPPRKLFKKM